MDPTAPPTQALDRILTSPSLKGLLLEHLRERYCAEVLLFHEAVVEYEAVEHEAWRRMKGLAIVDEYVRLRAANAINVDYAVSQAILECADKGTWTRDTFEAAKQEMRILMANDCLLPFTTSEKYRARISEALKSTLYVRILETKGLVELFGNSGATRDALWKVGSSTESATVIAGDNPDWGRTPFALLELDLHSDSTVSLFVLKENVSAADLLASLNALDTVTGMLEEREAEREDKRGDFEETRTERVARETLLDSCIATGEVSVSTFGDEAPRELWIPLDVHQGTEENFTLEESESGDEGNSQKAIESAIERETASVMVQAILIQYPSPEKHLWSVFSSPLHTCAAFGLANAVKTLVEKYGMDVDARIEGNRRTALHISCLRGQWRTAATLVRDLHADVDAVDNHGQTALHLCARFAPELLHILISAGAYLNPKDLMGRGETPLHCACAYAESPDAIRLLLESNADINAVTVDGQTPLHVAVTQNNPVAVGVLLEHSASMHCKDDNKKTPYQLASDAKEWNDSSRKVFILMENANSRDEDDA